MSDTPLTVEQVLLSRMKEDLSGLIAPDVLDQLAQRAITEVLFKDRRTGEYSNSTRPSPVMEAAERAAKDAANAMVEDMTKAALANDEIKQAMQKAFAAAIPAAMVDIARKVATSAALDASYEASNQLTEQLMSTRLFLDGDLGNLSTPEMPFSGVEILPDHIDSGC